MNRNYVLSQEVRELKARFDKIYVLEKEASGLKEENTSLLRELRGFQDNYQKVKND